MNFNMGTSGSSSTSGRQGFYDETEQGKHHPPSLQYPSSNSSSHHHQHHNLHRSWLDSHVGGGGGEGGSNSPLELMMDSSPTHVSRTTTTTTTGGGEDIEDSHSQAIMRELGQEGGGQVGVAAAVVEKEHMFDKVVTPSDVGKLNRLVIPKQHAERYFPLDSSTNEKGLLLNFEDRNGKPWRFRYSYWNSSQSYVMTKGWSRFVKEKKLDAGDIVSFQRGVGESAKDRLFIDWRRRPDAPPQELMNPVLANLSFPHHFSFQRSSNPSSPNINIHHPWNPMFLETQAGVPVPPPPPHSQQRGAHHAYSHSHLLLPQSNYINNMSTSTSSYGAYGGGGPVGPYGYNMGGGTSTSHVVNPCSGSVIYFRSAAAAPQQQLGMVQMQRASSHGGFHVPSSPGGVGVGVGIGIGIDPPPVVFESVPVVHGKAAAKRLRLFGVNMDCSMPLEDEGNHECEVLPSTTNTAAAATDQIMNMSNYNAHQMSNCGGYNTTPQNHYIRNSSNSSWSSSSTIPYLQLRPYSGTQIQTLVQQQHPPSSSSTTSTSDKGKASMSLDLDI